MSATAVLPSVLNFPGLSNARIGRKRGKLTLGPRCLRKVAKRRTAKALPALRTSQILREILTKNPTVKNFSVKRIVDSIGDTSFGTSLMFFSIPGMLPIPGVSTLVVIPTAAISGQMITGKKQIRLPKFILKKSVPRRSLAVAIHAILPFLEKAEKVTKPRWQWVNHPLVQPLLGLFVFILALAIAFPIPGFNIPQAISIFIIALGMVEKDGLTIALGVLAGITSLLLLGGVVWGIFSFLGIRVR
jgi:hypothetical protein